jgi:glycosyltransferase involved in cell wall biosynthesis
MSPDQRDGTSMVRHPAAGGVGGMSIVIPVYNQAAGLAALHARVCAIAAALAAERGLACEIVYVDDASRDASLATALALPALGVDIQVVSLSRNFGKEAALLAGLDHARLGAALFMDAAGQYPPALIEVESECDAVAVG